MKVASKCIRKWSIHTNLNISQSLMVPSLTWQHISENFIIILNRNEFVGDCSRVWILLSNLVKKSDSIAISRVAIWMLSSRLARISMIYLWELIPTQEDISNGSISPLRITERKKLNWISSILENLKLSTTEAWNHMFFQNISTKPNNKDGSKADKT